MIGSSALSKRDLWLPPSEDPPTYRRPVIFGCDGSPTSIRLIDAAPLIANLAGGVVLVCVVTPRRQRSPDHLVSSDILKGEAHLLENSTEVSEALQRGREAVRRAGLNLVAELDEPGTPLRSLLRAADRYQAAAIMVGMRRDRPSRQVNRLARRLPERLDLIASNGDEHLIACLRDRIQPKRRAPMLAATPRISEA